ncbi:PREDICTED: wall-associated receptor kinase-like 8 [Ipomoea nil]|uniref:wall-associated receptor kinase-like 8 n=1 Tax=Ipomoea nil TaxID=35883 RepID=UPI000900A7C0|nr:PREDICTED: wall-associated receptor kinase-like 8 [Ipomoea nil]
MKTPGDRVGKEHSVNRTGKEKTRHSNNLSERFRTDENGRKRRVDSGNINECQDRKENKCGKDADCVNIPGDYHCIPYHERHIRVIFVSIGGGIIGGVVLVIIALWVGRMYRRWKLEKTKLRFYKMNGGFLLGQYKKAAYKHDEDPPIKTFKIEVLEEATNNFNLSRVLEHLHKTGKDPLSWIRRLRIASEVATTLAFLHSHAPKPIIHRDVKSANILLNEEGRAKVSYFGLSKSMEIDQPSHLTSRIRGTYGYIDPEYINTNRLIDKSDVYAFGVVLMELLTGQKPISSSILKYFWQVDLRNHWSNKMGYFKF